MRSKGSDRYLTETLSKRSSPVLDPNYPPVFTILLTLEWGSLPFFHCHIEISLTFIGLKGAVVIPTRHLSDINEPSANKFGGN